MKMVVHLTSRDFHSERKVTKVLYPLNQHKKRLLLRAPLAEVLDLGFLKHVKLQRSKASLQSACDALALVCAALGIETLQGLQHLSVEDLAKLPGVGNKTLAVLLDLLQAFDIALAAKSKFKKLPQVDGKALAQKLGLAE